MRFCFHGAPHHTSPVPITLLSDFDQLRDHWVKNPLQYLTGAHIAPDGGAAVFTARGEVFTLPAVASGRVVKVAGNSGVRYREARYLPDGRSIIALSTATGEIERLGLGKVSGTRTWGGEVWLSFSNRLADSGIARAAEIGVYGPEGKWLIEGHGVDPGKVVDNLPHRAFTGGDAQLDAAIAYFEAEIHKDPRPVPKAPSYPNKAYTYADP